MAGRIDPAAVRLIETLPSTHRSYLFERHARRLVGARTVHERCERLAVFLRADIARYRNLYLPHNGSNFTWMRFPELNANANAIYNTLVGKYRGVLNGLRPRLADGGPPRLHRLIEYNAYFLLEYAALDGTRNYIQHFEQQTVRVDTIYRLVLRNDPFTVEVRAASAQKRHRLLQALSADAELNLMTGAPCLLNTDARIQAVRGQLDARFVNGVLNATGQGLSRTEFTADDESDLDATEPYRAELARADRREAVRTFEFMQRHPDGFVEAAQYHIVLQS